MNRSLSPLPSCLFPQEIKTEELNTEDFWAICQNSSKLINQCKSYRGWRQGKQMCLCLIFLGNQVKLFVYMSTTTKTVKEKLFGTWPRC